MKDDVCTGLWNENIVATLAATRRSAEFAELDEGFCGRYDKDGKLTEASYFPRQRPLSIKSTSYLSLSDPASFM